MIVAEEGSHLLFFTQCDHAALAARLLALWRRNGLPQNPRRDEVLFATREHDSGWQRADAAPRISPETGLPLSFNQMPPAVRLEIWRRCVRRHAAEHPYACRLIVRHARRVNQDYFGNPGWREFGAELDTLADALGELSDVEDADLISDHAALELVDTLSLGACGAFARSSALERKGHGYRFALEMGSIRLAPFPLAGVTTLEIPFRKLLRRTFSDTADLVAELVSAPWERRRVKVEPLRT